MLNCVIVDDDKLARELLEGFVQKIPTLNLKGTFYNALDILPLLENDEIDLIFLDIQMPDISGIDFIKSIEIAPKVILTTAYAEYALEGYELDVADYLLKPFPFERFLKTVKKVEKELSQKNETTETITIVADHKRYKVPLSDIIYIEGMLEYVRFHLADGRKITALQSMKKLEEILPDNQFIRIHKSHIVAINKATTLEGNMIHLGEIKLTIGQTYRESVKSLF